MAALPDKPKIVVHGAGSVGCWIGGTWAAAGLDIGFVGRKSVRDEIAEYDLNITDADGGRIFLPGDSLPFSAWPKALGGADIIALCVKSTGTEAAAKEIARHGRKGAAVISFQNGISNVEVLKAALPKFTIVQGMVPFNVARLGRGRWHKGVSGDLIVEDMPLMRDLAARIGDRPGRLRLAPDMKAVAWGKLLINLNNAVNALSGKTLLDQLRDRNYRRVVAASMVEALEILKAAGIEPAQTGPIPPRLLPHAIAAPDFIFRNILLKAQKIDANARSSMADDFAAGRPTEIDHLNGEVVKLAAKLGRRAPVNERIVELVRQAEAGVERIWSASELREHVLERHRGAPGFGY